MVEQLCLPSMVQRYTVEDYELLVDDVCNMSAATLLIPLPPLADLLLLADKPGYTAGGWRFSETGLHSFLRHLSPQLHPLVEDLCGMAKTCICAVPFDSGVAADVINKILTFRYASLSRRKILVRSDTRRIDGLVRPTGRQLDSKVLLEQSTAMAADSGFKFESATLRDRELCVWFRDSEAGYVDASHSFWRGLYVSHTETADTRDTRQLRTTHIAPAVMWTNGSSFGVFDRDNRLYSSQYVLQTALQRLLRSVKLRVVSNSTLCHRVKVMKQRPLGFFDIDNGGELLEAWRRRLTGRLRSRTLPGKVISRTVQYGATGVDSFIPGTRRTTVPRTLYDVYCVLSSMCRSWESHYRSAAEQLAYSILMGS